MTHVDLKKILCMDFHISHKSTGAPEEFAKKLNCSRSTLFEYLTYMRNELGVSILYNKYAKTYYYDGKDLYTILGVKPYNDTLRP